MTFRRRRGCFWGVVTVAVVLVVVIGVGVHALLTWDPRKPYVKDPRACPESNVSLDEVTAHFGLVIPEDATDVRFSSDLHPFFGEYNLDLSFQTTVGGLRTFLNSTDLPKPERDPYGPDVDGPSCGIRAASLHDLHDANDLAVPNGSVQLQVAVDGPGTATPRVVLSAMDL